METGWVVDHWWCVVPSTPTLSLVTIHTQSAARVSQSVSALGGCSGSEPFRKLCCSLAIESIAPLLRLLSSALSD